MILTNWSFRFQIPGGGLITSIDLRRETSIEERLCSGGGRREMAYSILCFFYISNVCYSIFPSFLRQQMWRCKEQETILWAYVLLLIRCMFQRSVVCISFAVVFSLYSAWNCQDASLNSTKLNKVRIRISWYWYWHWILRYVSKTWKLLVVLLFAKEKCFFITSPNIGYTGRLYPTGVLPQDLPVPISPTTLSYSSYGHLLMLFDVYV